MCSLSELHSTPAGEPSQGCRFTTESLLEPLACTQHAPYETARL